LIIITISLGLVAAIQILLLRSQQYGGVLFAPNINDLSVGQSFGYLYLPTIIAVFYSLLWACIDLDAKRLEPYYQLSKPSGAFGKDSLLLHYPFDFVAWVPLRALKRRHWPVFWAGTAMVVVFWGITPFQTGIFAVETINMVTKESMMVSTAFMTVEQQQSKLTANYTYSVYGIMWLNESLPPFMTRQYVLAPFSAPEALSTGSEHYMASTKLYSLDVECDKARIVEDETTRTWTSSVGCNIQWPYGPDGNDTAGTVNARYGIPIAIKDFSSLYAGFNNMDGMADFYISPYCSANASHNFFSVFTQNKAAENDKPRVPSAVFCRAKYYWQMANATVTVPEMAVVSAEPYGAKTPLPQAMFNSSYFEWQLTSGTQQNSVRGDVPSTVWPDPSGVLDPLSITQGPSAASNSLISLALGASQRPLEDYLEPEIMRKAWEDAYRLIFARSMADILSKDFDKSDRVSGQRTITTGAVVVVPAFAYLVEGLLSFVSICLAVLAYICCARERKLSSDPATMSAIMSMTTDNDALLASLKDLDSATEADICAAISENRYELLRNENGTMIAQRKVVNTQASSPSNTQQFPPPPCVVTQSRRGVQPVEFRMWAVGAFLSINIALVVTLAVLYVKSMPYGLKLRPTTRFVRQLVENYVPTAIATFIEPIWLMVNRLLCMLQPFEELRKGSASYRRSIGLDYHSLPPQLMIAKALRSRHFLLAAVCGMTLLANLLAVAFSGLFNEAVIDVLYPQDYTVTFDPLFTNSTAGTPDQIYAIMSNFTSNTPLPPWTDAKYFYVPFSLPSTSNVSTRYRASTDAFGAQLICTTLLAAPTRNTSEPTVTEIDGQFVYTSTNTYDDPIQNGADQQGSALLDPRTYGRSTSILEGGCPSGRAAAEALFLFNSTSPTHETGFAAGWFRKLTLDCNATDTLGSGNSTLLWCTPMLLHGRTNVTVDSGGHILAAEPFNTSTSDIDRFFLNSDTTTTTKRRLIRNANFHFLGHGAPIPWKAPTHPANEPAFALTNWHNDTFPGDFINYFITQLDPSKAALDPALSPPTRSDMAPLMANIYARVFAVLLSSHTSSFLAPAATAPADAEAAVVKGHVIRPELRVVMSRPLFFISEAILCLYIFVAVLLYCNRPDRFLPRYPTTVASVVAFFAAGRAVRDFKGMGGFSEKEGERAVGGMGRRYGFGRFVGGDGGTYVGIERAELVGELGVGSMGCSTVGYGGAVERKKGRGWRMPFRRQDSGSVAF